MANLDKRITASVSNIFEDASFTPAQRIQLIPLIKLFNVKITQMIRILEETSEALREKDAKIGKLEEALRSYRDELHEEIDKEDITTIEVGSL
jgi:hypothetical protein|tara:strand:- start:388 stop:666 length:279 start_codon:yes stop_codon:yes gene_type:complete